MSASGPGHDGPDEQESLEELFGAVLGLAGQIASRISQDQMEARLRRTLQAAGRHQEEEPARKAARRDPEGAGPGTGPTLAALVSQAAAGDRDAWDEIVERYAPLIWFDLPRALSGQRRRRGCGAGGVAAPDRPARSPPRSGRPGWLASRHNQPGVPPQADGPRT